MKAIFTKPKLCKSASGWYVHFRYNGKQFRIKGLSQFADLEDREFEAECIILAYFNDLKKGWNPTLKNQEQLQPVMNFEKAVNFALSEKKSSVSHKTYLDYSCTIRFCIEAANTLKLNSKPISDFTRIDLKQIITTVKNTRKWSNSAYNKNLTYLQAVLVELLDLDLINAGIFQKMKRLKADEDTTDQKHEKAHRPATAYEMQIIKNVLSKNLPFYTYIITIFHTLCRPVELLRMKVWMVNLEKAEIFLPKEITKGRTTDRVVPINKHLMPFFIAMELQNVPQDFYLFGQFGKDLKFIPAPNMMHRNRATELWKQMIIDGLGINVSMYSNKHSGIDAKIIAGIDLEAIKDLAGHTSARTTADYATKLLGLRREQLSKLSPDF